MSPRPKMPTIRLFLSITGDTSHRNVSVCYHADEAVVLSDGNGTDIFFWHCLCFSCNGRIRSNPLRAPLCMQFLTFMMHPSKRSTPVLQITVSNRIEVARGVPLEQPQ